MAIIERYGQQLRDDDPDRSRARAHHVWWNSGLSRTRMLALAETAYERTREQVSRGRVRSGPAGQRRAMGYFFAVLEDLAREEAERLRTG